METTRKKSLRKDAWGNHKLYNASGNEIGAEVLNIGNINSIRYRGYYYDSEFSLYYLQSRYYDPALGRFISPDDVSYLDPESIVGFNLYAYCGDNPIMNIDPEGCLFGLIIGIVAAVAAIAATINDIVQIAGGELTVTSSGISVNIENSYKIITPWMQWGYGIYLNHFNQETKNVIKGSSSGVQYEWMLHNVAYYLGIDREHSSAVDIGASIFSDDHGKLMGNGMKISYIVFGNPIYWIWDLIANGGYGKW